MDQYGAIALLGEGSFGTVLLCEHKHSGIKCAIKLIKKKMIKRVYTRNYQTYEELDIMQLVSFYNCP